MKHAVVTTGSDRQTFAAAMLAAGLVGAAALGLELVWLRLVGLLTGAESAAVSGLLFGLFLGMAAGAWILWGAVTRAARPGRVAAGLCGGLALHALCLPWVVGWLAPVLHGAVGVSAAPWRDQTLLALAGGVVLLPGAFCVGALLPAVVAASGRAGSGLAWLYGANLLGSALGVALSVLVLLPAWGIDGATVAWCAVLGVAGVLAARLRGALASATAPAADAPQGQEGSAGPWVHAAALFLCGAGGLGLQTAAVPVLNQVTEGTVYSFAGIVLAFLLWSAAGAWAWGAWNRLAPRDVRARRRLVVLGLLPWGVLLAALLLRTGGRFALDREVEGLGARVAYEWLLALGTLAAPAFLGGAVGSALLERYAGQALGRMLAANLLGAALAPLGVGLWLTPQGGFDAGFRGVLIAYGLAGLTMAHAAGSRRHPLHWFASFAALAGMLMPLATLRLERAEAGWTTRVAREGGGGLVRVLEARQPAGMRRLQVNRSHAMGGAFSFGERRMGALSALCAPRAERALFLGVGTGATLGGALVLPLGRVEAVDILSDIPGLLHWFDEVNGECRTDRRVTLHVADARRFVSSARGEYDLIVADLFHPSRDGASSLYAREHFAAMRERLTPGGVVVQWLPLHQMEPAVVRTILRTFLSVFPETHAWLGLYNAQSPPLALVAGRQGAVQLDPSVLALPGVERALRGVQLDVAAELAGAYLAGPQALRDFAGAGPRNTDRSLRVLFQAPRFLDGGGRLSGSLPALWQVRESPPATLFRGGLPEGAAARRRAVEAYVEAEFARAALGGFPDAAIEAYGRALAADPTFAAARALLTAAARLRPDRAETIRAWLQRAEGAAPR